MTETPPEPEPYPWLPLADVLARLGLDDQAPNRAEVDRARRAAAVYCQRQRRDLMVQLLDPADPAVVVGYRFDATDDVVEAGHLVAARLWERRRTPTAASFTELGAAEVARFDPDVAPMLGTGRFAAPRIG